MGFDYLVGFYRFIYLIDFVVLVPSLNVNVFLVIIVLRLLRHLQISDHIGLPWFDLIIDDGVLWLVIQFQMVLLGVFGFTVS